MYLLRSSMSIVTVADIQELVDELGPTLVALISANRRRTISNDWLAGDITPSEAESARLTTALRLFHEVSRAENSTDIARQWMIADNTPGYGMPCMAIRADDFAAAERSAQRLMGDAYS